LIKAPCKDCKRRKVTKDYNCHSHCKEYQEYIEDRNNYHRYNNGNNADYMDYVIKIAQRKIKRKNEKNRT
jgi:hypothetical protein